MTLRQLVRLAGLRPQLHWRRWLQISTLPLSGAYNSALALLERAVYGRRIARTTLSPAPLFILGHWRCGTTLLHNLLAEDPQFNYPNLYQVVFPNHFLVSEGIVGRLTAGLLPASRPMDNLPAGWHTPQEEDIAMAILTCLSPCMFPADPDNENLPNGLSDLSGHTPAQTAFWKQEFLRFLKKVSLDNPRPLVLKSPAHTFRIPLLLEMFPQARFAYIYRDPFDVNRSTIHMRRTVAVQNSLGCPKMSNLEERVCRMQMSLHDTYERDKRLIPAGHLHETRFEDLEQEPLRELESLYNALHLDGFPRFREIIAPQVPQLRRYRKNTFDSDHETMDRIYKRLQPLFEVHGYPHPAG
jgi:hypothetical protein